MATVGLLIYSTTDMPFLTGSNYLYSPYIGPKVGTIVAPFRPRYVLLLHASNVLDVDIVSGEKTS